ncbi:2-amino-3-ketobutyrate coenzyme A ligase [Mycobacterium basiliense]|uniref:8-amino-7-oxononanoate synthase n=1 Tax=Mycobacterium basiliense TaxID=2094119 RepID=A0A447G8Q4_9MYCO|nr:aminotransferase class I/II-fold pyridoxal phosphate-dependent enzyme [Mycobacterium basiliense]VDM86865.1 2-amino-3-ketobutyrate coenzyme A ligase [Mycobacterium basiliense]
MTGFKVQSETHRFRNNAKAVDVGNPTWQAAADNHLLDNSVRYIGNDRLERLRDGHRFINLVSCSYLGLHSHPWVLQGVHSATESEQTFALPVSRLRIRFSILDELESGLSALFGARCVAAISASVASAAVLPLIASGHLTDDGKPRVMVFDKLSHFSLNYIKPICADEAPVLTCPHNDLNYLEDMCKKHQRVAYVADGAYSLGGVAPVKELLELQDRYGLFLFFDDSHSLSMYGTHGEGIVRSLMPEELNPLTIIVASLGKAFGATGGVIMLGPEKHHDVLMRFGGPLAWSQPQNAPTIGGCLGSLRVHNSPELGQRQRQLRDNAALFDSLISTPQAGLNTAIRLIAIGAEAKAIALSSQILERGFYTSAVFFPVTAKGQAGLRIMLRADNDPDDIRRFCQTVTDLATPESQDLVAV